MKKHDQLKQQLKELKSLKKDFVASALRIAKAGNQNSYTLDLFAQTILNRAISITLGFTVLAEKNNYLAAIPLLRVQIDNCLKFFANTLVTDYNKLYIDYLKGKEFRETRSFEDKPLSDNYIATKLDEHFPGIKQLYKNSSGYVHLSNQHTFLNTKGDSEEERVLGIRVETFDFFGVDKKIEIVDAMIKFSELVIVVVEEWRHEKDRLQSSV